MTEGYKGLHGVTKGLQKVTESYIGLKGSQGVTKRLQGVTKGHNKLQGLTRAYMGLLG